MFVFIQTVAADEDSEALDRALARAAEAAAATEVTQQEIERRRPEVEARAREVEVLGEQLRRRALQIVDWRYSSDSRNGRVTVGGWGVAGPDGRFMRMGELSSHLGESFAGTEPNALVQDVLTRSAAGLLVERVFDVACAASTLSRGGCIAEVRRGPDPCWTRQGSRAGPWTPPSYLGEGDLCVGKPEGGGIPSAFND